MRELVLDVERTYLGSGRDERGKYFGEVLELCYAVERLDMSFKMRLGFMPDDLLAPRCLLGLRNLTHLRVLKIKLETADLCLPPNLLLKYVFFRAGKQL